MPLLAATNDLLSEVPAPPAATVELDGKRHAAECRALEQVVLAYLRSGWRIQGSRCFLLQPEVEWNSMEKFLDSDLAGASRQEFAWHDPGHDLVAVWKVGFIRPDYIACAMAKETIDGRPLVGYFSVKREK
jgi:hypothetical protein